VWPLFCEIFLTNALTNSVIGFNAKEWSMRCMGYRLGVVPLYPGLPDLRVVLENWSPDDIQLFIYGSKNLFIRNSGHTVETVWAHAKLNERLSGATFNL
jgi:hypothetical protein